jgi:hypothetical protein
MAVQYEVRNWPALYENAGSRKIGGALDWFPLPTKHDGLSYRRLMSRADGMELYSAWVLILAVAAKCPKRGILCNDEGPLTATDIALKTGGKESVFKRALQVLSSKEFQWLSGRTLLDRPDDLALHNTTGHYITEESASADSCGERSQASDSPPTAVELSGYEFPTRGNTKTYALPASKLAEYRESFPGMDVDRELRTALQWCRDNESRQKTAKGMPAFLSRWLAKSCDKATSNANRPSTATAPVHDPNRRLQGFG